MSKGTALSPAPTLVDGNVSSQYSPARRYVLLVIFCLAQFLDAFNNSSLFSAIPSLVIHLHIGEGESTWIISAFQLTFASFLLIVSAKFIPFTGSSFLCRPFRVVESVIYTTQVGLPVGLILN